MSAVTHLHAGAVAFRCPFSVGCDAGGCRNRASRVRYYPDVGAVTDVYAWLPVCPAHAQDPANDDFKPRGPAKAGGGGRRC